MMFLGVKFQQDFCQYNKCCLAGGIEPTSHNVCVWMLWWWSSRWRMD
jgi:hypothetical protein